MGIEDNARVEQFIVQLVNMAEFYAKRLQKKLKFGSVRYNVDSDSVLYYAYTANVIEKYVLTYISGSDKDKFVKGYASAFDRVIEQSYYYRSSTTQEQRRECLDTIDSLCHLLDTTSIEDYFALDQLATYLYAENKKLNENAYVFLRDTLFGVNQEIERRFAKIFHNTKTISEINDRTLTVSSQNSINSEIKPKTRTTKSNQSPFKRIRVGFFLIMGLFMFFGNLIKEDSFEEQEVYEETVIEYDYNEDDVDIYDIDYGVIEGNVLSIDYFNAEWKFPEEWDIMTDDYYMDVYRQADLDYYIYEFDLDLNYIDAYIGYNLENYDVFIIEVIDLGEEQNVKEYVKYQRDYFEEIEYFNYLTKSDVKRIKNKQIYSFEGYVGEIEAYEFAAKYSYIEKNGVYLQISLFSYYDLESFNDFIERF